MIKRATHWMLMSLWVGIASLAVGCSNADGEFQMFEDACDRCGVIESITPRRVEGEPSAGAVIAGAIVGGVVGHQFGGGSGKDAATAAGAVGGAYAGSEIDKNRKAYTVYDVTIRMHEGGVRELTLYSREGLSVGEEVQVTGERVTPA